MPESVFGAYGFMECFLVHCLLCGRHHPGVNHYCGTCMETRYDEVERDAKIRSYSGKWSVVAACTDGTD